MLIERDGVATPPPWPDVTWTLLNGFLTRGGCELRAAEFAARKSGIPCMGTKRRGDVIGSGCDITATNQQYYE